MKKIVYMFCIIFIILLVNTVFFQVQDTDSSWYIDKLNVEGYNKIDNEVKVGIIDSGYYDNDNIENHMSFLMRIL